jgi:7-cyano-7-deazaguanine synthase
MSLVSLVSGGIDSTLMAILAKEEGIPQSPLFINYGQICAEREMKACLDLHKRFGLPVPAIMDVSGFGQLIASGLTNPDMRVYEDAFLPGRNLLFLLAGAAYAYQTGSNAVAIGLLSEETHLFPDQTAEFLENTGQLVSLAMGRRITVVAPLMRFTKMDVIELARQKGITGTYSCHAGTESPCGICVSCREAKKALEGGI